MAVKTLGVLSVTAGTPIQCSATRIPCQAYMVQAHPANDDIGACGSISIDYSADAGIFGYIGVPTATVIPAFSARHSFAPGAFNMADLWLDCASGTQKFVVTYVA